MKINKIFSVAVVCLGALALAGCSLLDVSPRMQEESEDLLANEDGLKFAVTGVYLGLADKKLYGASTTYEVPEWLVRHFNVSTVEENADNYYFSNHNFEDNHGDKRLDDMWTGLYHSISQANDILQAMDKGIAKFRNTQLDSITRGEMYGMRAFLHLDVLRYWGPVPNAEVVESTVAVPYVTAPTFLLSELPSVSWKTIVDGIASDLSKAEAWLKDAEPIFDNGLKNDNSDTWLRYRQNRMNYFAVLATKARFYAWIANTGYAPVDPTTQSADARANAVRYAWMVYNGRKDYEANVAPNRRFTLIGAGGISTNSFTLFDECLLALDVEKMQNNQEDFNIRVGTAALQHFAPNRHQLPAPMKAVYEDPLYVDNDMRYTSKGMWYNTRLLLHGPEADVMVFRKFKDSENPADENVKFSSNKNQMPLIRLSEMYLIMMEFDEYTRALDFFKDYRTIRGMDPSVEATFTDDDGRQARIQKEYEKEFYGEGQFFFYCKRFNLAQLPIDNWPMGTNGKIVYVLPKPLSQKNYEK